MRDIYQTLTALTFTGAEDYAASLTIALNDIADEIRVPARRVTTCAPHFSGKSTRSWLASRIGSGLAQASSERESQIGLMSLI